MSAIAQPWVFRVFIIRHRGRRRQVEVYSPASLAAARFAAGKADDEELSEKRLEAFDARFRSFFARKSATVSELEKFYTGMAEALHLGADFRSALDMVAPSAETAYFRGVNAALYEQKAQAASIAALMRNFPGAFNNVAVAMIEQGETAGRLELVFDKLAVMTRNRLMISGEIKAGLYYPGFIFVLLHGRDDRRELPGAADDHQELHAVPHQAAARHPGAVRRADVHFDPPVGGLLPAGPRRGGVHPPQMAADPADQPEDPRPPAQARGAVPKGDPVPLPADPGHALPNRGLSAGCLCDHGQCGRSRGIHGVFPGRERAPEQVGQPLPGVPAGAPPDRQDWQDRWPTR